MSQKKGEKKNVTIIFSGDFIITEALRGLQRLNHGSEVYVIHALDSLLQCINDKKPEYIILDISARDSVNLLCSVRRHFPVLPIIITRHRHLFSDYVVADWFGHIWLRDYDALMAAYPDGAPTDCVTRQAFAGTQSMNACSLFCTGKKDVLSVMSSLRHWLAQRLQVRLSSRRGIAVIMNWLEMGGTARDVGRRMARSEKLAYHYRRQVKLELNIKNVALEFIPSVSVSEGCVNPDCSSYCRLRHDHHKLP